MTKRKNNFLIERCMAKRDKYLVVEDGTYLAYDFEEKKWNQFVKEVKITSKTKEKLDKIFNLYKAAQDYIEFKVVQAL